MIKQLKKEIRELKEKHEEEMKALGKKVTDYLDSIEDKDQQSVEAMMIMLMMAKEFQIDDK